MEINLNWLECIRINGIKEKTSERTTIVCAFVNLKKTKQWCVCCLFYLMMELELELSIAVIKAKAASLHDFRKLGRGSSPRTGLNMTSPHSLEWWGQSISGKPSHTIVQARECGPGAFIDTHCKCLFVQTQASFGVCCVCYKVFTIYFILKFVIVLHDLYT